MYIIIYIVPILRRVSKPKDTSILNVQSKPQLNATKDIGTMYIKD